MENKMKKESQENVDIIVKAIRVQPKDDSNKPVHSTRGNMIKSLCYSYTNRVNYLKTQYQNTYAEWELLKDKVADGLSNEGVSRSIVNKLNYMEALKPSLKNSKGILKAVLTEHKVFFKDVEGEATEYSLPVSSVRQTAGNQEIVDVDTIPEKL
jgi:hypothetical protein